MTRVPAVAAVLCFAACLLTFGYSLGYAVREAAAQRELKAWVAVNAGAGEYRRVTVFASTYEGARREAAGLMREFAVYAPAEYSRQSRVGPVERVR